MPISSETSHRRTFYQINNQRHILYYSIHQTALQAWIQSDKRPGVHLIRQTTRRTCHQTNDQAYISPNDQAFTSSDKPPNVHLFRQIAKRTSHQKTITSDKPSDAHLGRQTTRRTSHQITRHTFWPVSYTHLRAHET